MILKVVGKLFSYQPTFSGKIWYDSRHYCLPHCKAPEPFKYPADRNIRLVNKNDIHIGEIMNKTTFMAKPGQVERKWYALSQLIISTLQYMLAYLREKNKTNIYTTTLIQALRNRYQC